ncbi:MAG: cupin domain-containing protein [Acidobacteria bacterium]|nr:cupin domain-containing protein [Acidobacteriota bacterium]
MDLLQIEDILPKLASGTAEIQSRRCFRGENYEVGLISFAPGHRENEKQIVHADKDVVCQALRGTGRLRIGEQEHPLRAGNVVRIPAGTPHDFSATDSPLLLFYVLVSTGPGSLDRGRMED